MPFLPHTESDVQAMLKAIGVDSIDQLFDEIPKELLVERLQKVPETANEMEVVRLMKMRAARDAVELNFAGAGAYEHHIPAAVWQIVGRGEFYSAYTPYQAEASQGTLQLIYEYQTMMTRLTGTDISNASMYDGATAMAEAVLMAERSRKKRPARRACSCPSRCTRPGAARSPRSSPADIEVVDAAVPGRSPRPGAGGELRRRVHRAGDPAAELFRRAGGSGRAHRRRAEPRRAGDRAVNPMSLALLKAPGRWGARGADIVCGDGQPLGVPMSSGRSLLRLPGLQEGHRAQHARPHRRPHHRPRRQDRLHPHPAGARAAHPPREGDSNICTNQGLLVTAATIYMAITGPEGLRRVAAASAANLAALRARLEKIPGVRCPLPGRRPLPRGALELPTAAQPVIEKLAGKRILAGVCPGADYAGMQNVLLLCTTETKSSEDLEAFASALEAALA
jgi:glycine dehydrogenase subunit 1